MATLNGVTVQPINGIVSGTDDSDIIIAEAADSGITLNGGLGFDTLQSSGTNNTLLGGLGDDSLESTEFANNTTMDGGSGSDFLVGGGTNDTASYASASAGVVVDLSTFSASDGDFLSGIENVTGSAFDDTLNGDAGANVLRGGAGNDALTGGAGDDIFNYSFNLAQGSGGGSTTTHTFTDWLSEKYGKDYGDELPDYVPAHHHKHDKDDKHAKNDKHHSKDDGHHSKDGGHDHHGHGGDNGHHAPNSGLTEKFFEQNYKEWIKEVVVADLLEQGFVLDANGDGKIKIDINDDSRNGTPRIEGLTKDQLAEIFGDRDSVILRDGHHAEKAWYSNSFTSASGGEATAAVTSGDGFDTIVDFGNGADKLQFDFSADSTWADGQADPLAYLESFFTVGHADFTSDSVIDTSLSVDMNNDGNAEWSVVLAGSDLTDAQVFAALDISVNGTLIG